MLITKVPSSIPAWVINFKIIRKIFLKKIKKIVWVTYELGNPYGRANENCASYARCTSNLHGGARSNTQYLIEDSLLIILKALKLI